MQRFNIVLISAVALGLSGSLLASGVTSAPSEASTESSSKQSSDGSSASSSGSSDRNNFVANNLALIQLEAARNGGPTLQALAHQHNTSEAAVVSRLQAWLTQHPKQTLSQQQVLTLLD